MNDIIKRGKSLPITITPEIRNSIEQYRMRLIQMAGEEDETSDFDRTTVDIITNQLDDYDRNILLAYYAVADCSPTKLAKLLGINNSSISHKIKRIIKIIKSKNATPKTAHNHPRKYLDY